MLKRRKCSLLGALQVVCYCVAQRDARHHGSSSSLISSLKRHQKESNAELVSSIRKIFNSHTDKNVYDSKQL